MEYIGIIAGAITTFGFVPQVIRVYKLKSAREISLLFNLMLLLGIALWVTYGIIFSLLPVILWNVITGLLVAALLTAKIKYNR